MATRPSSVEIVALDGSVNTSNLSSISSRVLHVEYYRHPWNVSLRKLCWEGDCILTLRGDGVRP